MGTMYNTNDKRKKAEMLVLIKGRQDRLFIMMRESSGRH